MNWKISRPDKTYQTEVEEENEAFRKAKLEALNNQVLRFSCAVRALITEALRASNNALRFSFNRPAFESDLEALRPVLDSFYEGKISIFEAEHFLRPVVLDSLYGIPVANSSFLTKEALRSIEKIKI